MRPLLALLFLIGLALAPPMLMAQPHRGERTVELRLGHSTNLAQGTILSFDKVIADSRCPVDVTCVWAGEAKLQFSVRQPSQRAEDFVLTTPLAPEVEIAKWRIKIVTLLPPRHSGDGDKKLAYVVTLAVTPLGD